MFSLHFARHLMVTGLAALLWGAVAATAHAAAFSAAMSFVRASTRSSRASLSTDSSRTTAR